MHGALAWFVRNPVAANVLMVAVVLVGATAMFAWFRKNGGDGKSERAAANPSPSFTAVAMPAAPPRPRDARRAPPKPPRTDLMAPKTPREDSTV